MDGGPVHWRDEGDPKGRAVVFAHALGLDLSMWDAVLPLLPRGLRLVRYDLRGHGQSAVPPGPYSMGGLIRDAETLLDDLGIRDCVFVGLSVGGLIAQGLAVKRLDQIRGLVLSNTAAKIATKEIWQARVDKVMAGGMAGVADDVLSRWFAPKVRMGALGQAVRARFLNAPVTGYAGVAAAVGGADFLTPTSGLRLPTLVIAGSADGATPPDLVRELADLIPGADYHLIRGAGHLPPIDRAAEFAAKLSGFLHGVGHV